MMMMMSSPLAALELSGPALVTDGDTIAVGAQKMRLYGIDAFEDGQDCKRKGRFYDCGADSENALRILVRGGVSCVGSQFDTYDRLIATCRTMSGEDVSAMMVRAGHALAYRKYSSAYVAEEDDAKLARRGAWAGTFTAPWAFRAARWSDAGSLAPDPACPIKGNINLKGDRIYHAPWSRYYNRTKINTAKGERWFCDEGEAQAAGWLAPHR